MKVHRLLLMLALALVPLVCLAPAVRAAAAEQEAWVWYEVDSDRNVHVNLYLFWSARCSHCAKALDFTENLKARRPWVNVYAYEITSEPANLELYQRMAASLNRVAGQVPAFFFCKQLEIGYESYENNGARIERGLIRWYEALQRHYRPGGKGAALAPGSAGGPALVVGMLLLDGPAPEEPPDLPIELPPEEPTFNVPVWGEVGADQVSLPALTLVMAGCDAFNPCAFFVLLFLLSLLIHGRSRWRMALVGGVFVFFSALVYFLFMAAWLNLFFLVGHLRIITIAAGAVAVGVALVNVKDYFWFKRGLSLSIPESVKPGMYQRMTRLIGTTSLASILAGSAALAAAANLYELLCTSGFPLVYTRVLTLRQLPTATYYSYLVLYNLIYVAPMALIVAVFTLTLGSRKLSEYEGRMLKLLSGVMMLVLGLLLLVRPEMLNTVAGAIGTLAVALGATAVVVVADRIRLRLRAGNSRSAARHDEQAATSSARPAADSAYAGSGTGHAGG
jgi:hypothetical protein